ncbi:MAG: hypothetical protein NC123_19250 [Butyrivibrio sp.]|nr:hypothetical protein [Butyrivibrio sp.]
MGGQSQEFGELIRFVTGAQVQLVLMREELQGVRQELSHLQEGQPRTATEGLMDRMARLQEKVTDLSERLSAVKDHLVETAAQALHAFQEKGKAAMCDAIRNEISGGQCTAGTVRESAWAVKGYVR